MIVYILRTEEDITPKYVGITTKSLKDRLYKHIYDINRATCKNYHKIECLINNNWIEFSSATKAAIELNLLRSKIVLVCKGERTHTGGYKFRYKKK
jgi:hypothetical protein